MATTASIAINAAPAFPGNIEYCQPDGSRVTFTLMGDEHGSIRLSTDGYALEFDEEGWLRYAKLAADGSYAVSNAPVAHDVAHRSQAEIGYLQQLAKPDCNVLLQKRVRESAANVQPKSTFPTEGKIKGVVLLVEFQERGFTFDWDYHNRMMNEEGFSDDGATGSARDYYLDQSNGRFEIDFDVFGPIKVSKRTSYYGNNTTISDAKMGNLVEEACTMASEQFGCKFSDYDFDNDGKVDMVYILYAGYGENAGAPSSSIWPHKSTLTNRGIELTLDGKQIDVYACSSELAGSAGKTSSHVGILVHEFSHILGFPDLYQTNYYYAYAVDNYDVMATGCYNNGNRTPPCYSAFERYMLGWLEPDEPSVRKDGYRLTPLMDNNVAVRLSTSNINEYFLLENRAALKWDAHLPSNGLLISHVYYNGSTYEANAFNNNPDQLGVSIVPADNVASIATENDDTYPSLSGNNSFTDNSVPASITYGNKPIDKWVTDIRKDGDDIVFNFMSNHEASVESLSADCAWLTTAGRNICLTGKSGEVYAVYTPDGLRVAGGSLVDEQPVSMELPLAGIYLVTKGTESAKIIVK